MSAASAPTVSTPAACSRCSAFGPTPGRRRTSNGARYAASWPGTTTTSPPGLRASLPTFATTLQGATPSEHVRLVPARTAVRTASATTRASRKSAAISPRSRYPSSIPVCSTVGTTPRTVDQTWREYSRYSAWRGRTKTAVGHRRIASAALIAEWIPKPRAT